MVQIIGALAISARFNDDGQCFRDIHGAPLLDVLNRAAISIDYARHEWSDDAKRWVAVGVSRSDVFDATRYGFADGSAIIVCGDAWDVEGKAPFSWSGAE